MHQSLRPLGVLLTLSLSVLNVAAGDFPVKAEPPIMPLLPEWGGFYIGLHGGYGWARDPMGGSSSSIPSVSPSDIKSQGAILGGQAGFNWQSGPMLGGLEFDMTWTRVTGAWTATAFDPTMTVSVSQTLRDHFDYLGTARARAGFITPQNVLLFLTGGVAWAQTSQENLSASAVVGQFSFTSSSLSPVVRFGWAAGGGVETSLAAIGLPNWLIRAEYLHYDLGGRSSSSGQVRELLDNLI